MESNFTFWHIVLHREMITWIPDQGVVAPCRCFPEAFQSVSCKKISHSLPVCTACYCLPLGLLRAGKYAIKPETAYSLEFQPPSIPSINAAAFPHGLFPWLGVDEKRWSLGISIPAPLYKQPSLYHFCNISKYLWMPEVSCRSHFQKDFHDLFLV